MVALSLCETNPLDGAVLPAGFCVGQLPVSVNQPRSILALKSSSATDFLTLERGTGSVLVGEDLNGDGIPETMRTLVSLDGIDHGLEVTSTHLYASTTDEVYRWPYDPITQTVTSSTPELLIENISVDSTGGTDGVHKTRTLVVDEAAQRLYVTVGSEANIAPNSFRARIRVFDLKASNQFPIDFSTGGQLWADGLRNEVALEQRPQDGVLWGAGNSADTLSRDDLGGDGIVNDNPAEELHRFGDNINYNGNYGYPFCFREYNLGAAGLGRGTAWAWPSFLENQQVTDQQCRSEYKAPVLAMQGHSAPLGLTFYQFAAAETRPVECKGVEPFPESTDGDLFIAFHGSWNRVVPDIKSYMYRGWNRCGWWDWS